MVNMKCLAVFGVLLLAIAMCQAQDTKTDDGNSAGSANAEGSPGSSATQGNSDGSGNAEGSPGSSAGSDNAGGPGSSPSSSDDESAKPSSRK